VLSAEALAPAPPLTYTQALRDLALGLVGRGSDLLLLGLAPWEQAGLPQALVGRARGVVAVDPDKGRLLAARPYCHKTIEAPLDGPEWSARLEGQRFATVILGDGLTHGHDPLALLRRAREALLPDGQLVAVVPNAAWGESRLDLLAGDVPREWLPGAPRQRYTRERLREALALTGFRLDAVEAFRTPLFGANSGLVPELFPVGVLQALGPAEDAEVSHWVIRALPAAPEALIGGLFAEQEALRSAVRNELARLTRANDGLTERLEEADAARAVLAAELENAQKQAAGLADLAERADQNVRRLGQEADDAQRALRQVQESLGYRLLRWLTGGKRPPPEPTPNSLPEWKVEEPKNRYL
jgi:SAM-dependent methyltransferase